MNPSDQERDALTDQYRQASADDAGRPGADVRKAILAEAAAAARRRTPAANDSRYLWRGVAGVAVLGFAILMWKQVDHRIPGAAPQMAARSEPQAEVLLEAAPPAAAKAETKGANSEQAFAPQPAPVVAQDRAPAAVADREADVAAPAQAAAPVAQMRAAEAESSAKASASSEVASAIQAVPAPAPALAPVPGLLRNELARAGKMSAAQDAEIGADALLRLQFPRQYQSDTPHSVWLVQDAAGAVLRSGELAAGKTFAEIRPEIERELGGRLLRPWRIRSLQNARGQTIELGIAQTP